MWMQKVVYSKWAPVIGLCESDLDLCVWATYLFSGVVKLRRSASASWLKLQTDKIDVDSFWFITIHSKKGNTFTSSVLRARGGTQDMWTWITQQKLETLDKKSTRLGHQRQLFPSKLTLTAFQYLYYYYYYVPIWSMWNAVCQKGQDVPLHLVTFCSMHSFCSVLLWLFWPTLLRPAKHVTVRRMNIKQSRESRRTFDSSLAAHSSVGTFFFVLQNVVLMPR